MKAFNSQLASAKVRVFEISKDGSLVVRDSNLLIESGNLYGRDARRNARGEAIAQILAVEEMEKVIRRAMGANQ